MLVRKRVLEFIKDLQYDPEFPLSETDKKELDRILNHINDTPPTEEDMCKALEAWEEINLCTGKSKTIELIDEYYELIANALQPPQTIHIDKAILRLSKVHKGEYAVGKYGTDFEKFFSDINTIKKELELGQQYRVDANAERMIREVEQSKVKAYEDIISKVSIEHRNGIVNSIGFDSSFCDTMNEPNDQFIMELKQISGKDNEVTDYEKIQNAISKLHKTELEETYIIIPKSLLKGLTIKIELDNVKTMAGVPCYIAEDKAYNKFAPNGSITSLFKSKDEWEKAILSLLEVENR